MTFKTSTLLIGVFSLAAFYSCSKKTVPTRTPEETVIIVDTVQSSIAKPDTLVAVEKAPVKIKKKPKQSIPKVITVNDNAAKTSVDGRRYYDLQGHRYWRNNKDGKYYLFNKSMNTDPDFKKP